MAIVWLASYPKSGNTWTRAFLANYMSDGEQPADINMLSGDMSHLQRNLFDDCMGIPSSDMSRDELQHYRPIFHRLIAEGSEDTVFLKSHEAHRQFPSGESFFAPVDGCKVIHLVRNPLDVVTSYAHHNNESADRTIARMAKPDALMSGAPLKFFEVMGDWSSFNRSWLEQTEISGLTLRYEDMLANPKVCFEQIVDFIGLELDPTRLVKALTFSNFSNLQKQEEKSGFREKMVEAKAFFRKGVAGEWVEKLTPDQTRTIVADHRDIMVRLGYDIPQIAD